MTEQLAYGEIIPFSDLASVYQLHAKYFRVCIERTAVEWQLKQ